MAGLKTVTGLVKDAGGNPLAGVEVRAVLSQGVTIPGVQETPPTSVKTKTAPDGTWSLLLYANLDLTPSTTSYVFHEAADAPRVAVVPQAAGPFALSNILAAAPTPSPPAALDSAVVHIASPTGQEKITGKKVFGGGTPWFDLGADAVGDGQFLTNVACVAGQAQLSGITTFTQTDVGKSFDLYGGTGPGITGTQTGTILSVDANGHPTLSVAPNANATNAFLIWATDDTANVNVWAARAGRLRVAGGVTGLFFVKGTITFPLATCQIVGGPGSLWMSAVGAANPFLKVDSCLAHSFIKDRVVLNCSLGFTGRFIQGVTANEAGSDILLRDISAVQPTDGADYMVFLSANVATLERLFLNANNKLSNKALAHSAVISGSEAVNSSFIGRVYVNAQAYALRNCTTGPIRAANNSASDGTGNALQTNTLTIDGSCYVYSSSLGGTDFPCIESVAATAAGEGAAGGAFPNLLLDGPYLVMGAGAGLTQYAISGNFTCVAGSTGLIADAVGFVQSSTSPATKMVIVRSTGGAPSIYGRNCAASIVATTATAKVYEVPGGTAECVWDFMPSGQATVWEHPTVSILTAVPLNLPASGAWIRNAFPTAYDIWITPGANAITKVEISPDAAHATIYTLWTGVGATVVPLIFRWPSGTYLRFTYAGGQPTYMLVPAP